MTYVVGLDNICQCNMTTLSAVVLMKLRMGKFLEDCVLWCLGKKLNEKRNSWRRLGLT